MKSLQIIGINLCLVLFISCHPNEKKSAHVINDDINRFWMAFDTISKQHDSLLQIKLLEELYLSKATPGLNGIIQAKRYTTQDFLNMIEQYPKFLSSVRPNTLKADQYSTELELGIEKLKSVYPELRPAKIYFTIGAMRSGGTTIDSLVLIGSELAMMDDQSDISEFEGRLKDWAVKYQATKPLDNIILLNVHEYVHTQQNPIPNSTLYQCLYEGVAEFVSVKAMEMPSSTPAVAFGENNPKVKKVFENEMFYNQTFKWLWSNAPNQFEIRDLGYYIGYKICELHYNKAEDKKLAIKELIEIDYNDTKSLDALIDETKFFSKPIDFFKQEDLKKRPKVNSIAQFINGQQDVDPSLDQITLQFSSPLNGYNTGVDYGELGKDAFPKITETKWSNDALSWTMNVELEANKEYQILISNNFRNKEKVPLIPFLIEFRTSTN